MLNTGLLQGHLLRKVCKIHDKEGGQTSAGTQETLFEQTPHAVAAETADENAAASPVEQEQNPAVPGRVDQATDTAGLPGYNDLLRVAERRRVNTTIYTCLSAPCLYSATLQQYRCWITKYHALHKGTRCCSAMLTDNKLRQQILQCCVR